MAISPNEMKLYMELTKARVLRPLVQIHPEAVIRDKGPRCPQPTKYSVRGLETNKDGEATRYYLYFDDGSLRRAIMVGRTMTFERKLVVVKRKRGPAVDRKRLRRNGIH